MIHPERVRRLGGVAELGTGASESGYRLSRAARQLHHRKRDRAIERHHRVVGHAFEQAVQRQDLRPVRVVGAGGFVMDRCDRRLDLISAHPAVRERRGQDRHAFGNRLLVPRRPFLFGERDQLAVRSRPRRAPGIGQEHQREQPRRLGVAREHAMDGAGQPNRFAGEVAPLQSVADAARIAFVEDQVEHVQHRAQALGPLLAGGHAERDARRLDPLLRPADALRHRGLGHQVRVGDLGRRQAADRPKRQGDRGRSCQRRVTAHEQQDERVVAIGRGF